VRSERQGKVLAGWRLSTAYCNFKATAQERDEEESGVTPKKVENKKLTKGAGGEQAILSTAKDTAV
jgi:hypothetical protein